MTSSTCSDISDKEHLDEKTRLEHHQPKAVHSACLKVQITKYEVKNSPT